MKKRDYFKWEMMIALIVKFSLFGLLWWLFFAGHKIKIDEEKLTQRLFGTDTFNYEGTLK